jgi:hypothetical protein
MRYLGAFAMAAPLLVAVVAEPASAQKTGGIPQRACRSTRRRRSSPRGR